jgi:anaerobic selenocysteine-containing dehydrogenase
VFSKGFLCPKAIGLKDLHDDPDRLRVPLIKRDGKFVEGSWDEAYAEIERRLPPIIAAGGPDSVATVLGNPTSHKMSLMLYFPRLAKALGTRNMFSASSVDQVPKMLSSGLMFGGWLSVPVPDIERCDFLLILGANPMVSNGSLWTVPDFRGKARALRARRQDGRGGPAPHRDRRGGRCPPFHSSRRGCLLPARHGASAIRRRAGAAGPAGCALRRV